MKQLPSDTVTKVKDTLNKMGLEVRAERIRNLATQLIRAEDRAARGEPSSQIQVLATRISLYELGVPV